MPVKSLVHATVYLGSMRRDDGKSDKAENRDGYKSNINEMLRVVGAIMWK